MSEERIKILVVDDDIQFLIFMRDMLEHENYNIITASDGQTTLKVFKDNSPSLVLLDIMLPDIDGYTVCRNLRSFSEIPIILVSAKDSENDKIAGLNAGADDYITKPFLPDELAARISAVLRRSSALEMPSFKYFQCHDLRIDFIRQKVTLGQGTAELTSTEYRIVAFLAMNSGKIVAVDEILKEIWGEANSETSHSLQVNISRLRDKLHDTSPNFKYIETRYGKGYLIRKRPSPDISSDYALTTS